jgi:hypothetical protein
MTKNLALILALFGMLAACSDGSGSNPVYNEQVDEDNEDTGDEPITPDEGVEIAVPEELAQNVSRITYSKGRKLKDDSDDKLRVKLSALDQPPKVATYLRNAALDVPGFKAFSVQDDPLDRMFVAVTAEDEKGNVRATAVADGGQFRRFFRGTSYERTGDYTHPTTGLVSFAGRYAGVTNLNDPDQDQLLDVPKGTDTSLYPAQPRQTKGKVFLNVDFDDNAVNGSIYQRKFADNGENLSDVNLIEGTMNKKGEFLGTAELTQTPRRNGRMVDVEDPQAVGPFGGVIGTDAKALAGTVVLDSVFHGDDPRDGDLDAEVGTFVLPRCGTRGAPKICDDVNDFD